MHGKEINIKNTNMFLQLPKGSKQINIKSMKVTELKVTELKVKVTELKQINKWVVSLHLNDSLYIAHFIVKTLYCCCYNVLLHSRIKIIHLIGWTLSTWPSLRIPRYRLECWYRPVQKPCIDWYYWSMHGHLFVYVLINYNVTYNLILSWTPFKQLL